VIPPPS